MYIILLTNLLNQTPRFTLYYYLHLFDDKSYDNSNNKPLKMFTNICIIVQGTLYIHYNEIVCRHITLR